MKSTTEKAKEWLADIRENGENYDPLVTYYFVDKGLEMSPGKLGVQVARAGQVMLLGELKEDDSLLFDSLNELFADEFMHGNKSICLKANSSQMNRLLEGDLSVKVKGMSEESGVPIRLYPVYDIGANEVEPNSLTVIGMTPVPLSVIKPLSKKFQLYK